MGSRSHEGPMDWEYHDRGPCDPTSPFTQAATAASGSMRNLGNMSTDSPFRPRLNNSFAGPSTPSRPQPQPPQTPRFTPQLSSQAASPFRNPAFTTPRKPFDGAFSEASGPEDSPALTETSEYPNDTPESERRAGATLEGPFAPSKVDKMARFGRPALSARKHVPGKGDLRPHRDLLSGARKRKRLNFDKDVSSIGRFYSAQDSDVWDSDSDGGAGSRGGNRTQTKGEGGQAKGAFEAFFSALNKYPNTPDHMQRWILFCSNLFLATVLAYIGWSVVTTVRSDISRANDAARMELMSRMTECQTQYTMNECSKKDRPALRLMCEQWYDCMVQNPESIMQVKVTAKQVAEIINEFTETMHLKAWGFVIALILVCTTVSVRILGRQGGSMPAPPPAHDVASNSFNETPRSSDIASGYMLVPMQSPRMDRRAMLAGEAEVDMSPLYPKTALPQGTPSRRPTKRSERPLSPAAWDRTPSRRALS